MPPSEGLRKRRRDSALLKAQKTADPGPTPSVLFFDGKWVLTGLRSYVFANDVHVHYITTHSYLRNSQLTNRLMWDCVTLLVVCMFYMSFNIPHLGVARNLFLLLYKLVFLLCSLINWILQSTSYRVNVEGVVKWCLFSHESERVDLGGNRRHSLGGGRSRSASRRHIAACTRKQHE
jgi:hypothetical protein